jgi:hypothetical protein
MFWRAWSIWAVSAAVISTALAYTVIRPLPASTLADFGVTGVNDATALVFIGAFATVGALLAWKRPQNPIGWLLSATGLAVAVGGFGLFPKQIVPHRSARGLPRPGRHPRLDRR